MWKVNVKKSESKVRIGKTLSVVEIVEEDGTVVEEVGRTYENNALTLVFEAKLRIAEAGKGGVQND